MPTSPVIRFEAPTLEGKPVVEQQPEQQQNYASVGLGLYELSALTANVGLPLERDKFRTNSECPHPSQVQ